MGTVQRLSFPGSTVVNYVDDLGRQVCELPRPVDGLEMFSRSGSFVTWRYASLCDTMEFWEVNPDYVADLKQKHPSSIVREVDSIKFATKCESRYSVISMDTPQGTYSDYCEHFEIMRPAVDLLRSESILLFSVNVLPYRAKAKAENDNYGMRSHSEWFARRNTFYGRSAECLSLDFVHDFYSGYLSQGAHSLVKVSVHLLPSEVEGHPPYLARCIARFGS